MCIALLLLLNMVSVKVFGELEFWFALIKIVAIMALIVCGIYLVITGFVGPTGEQAKLSNLWEQGWFPHGMSGFFAAFQIAVFAFVGIELVGTASAETADPYKTLPKAINKIPVRVIVFYVLALMVIMTVTPWSSVAPDKSPFVNMFTLIGIGFAAALINFVVLTSALSSANSGMYSTGRMLFGLADKKLAPDAFAKLSSNGVPRNGLFYSCALLLIGVGLLYADGNVMHVFTVVTTISSIGFFFVWTMILLSYIKYRKVRPEAHGQSTYKMPFGVPMCYLCLAFFVFVLALFWQEADTRLGLQVTPLWFIALAICYPFYKKRLQAQ